MAADGTPPLLGHDSPLDPTSHHDKLPECSEFVTTGKLQLMDFPTSFAGHADGDDML